MLQHEYKIGNIVEYNNEEARVTGLDSEFIYINKITFDYLNYEEVSPVILTKERLPKFGFVQDPKLSYRWNFPNKEITYDLDDNCIQIGGSWDWKKIKYVHEMQNLIYELIKKEI